MTHTLDALFYPFTICLDPIALKYLLLLYDRILYLPIDNALNPGHETLSKRWSMYDAILYAAFGGRDQTARALMYAADPSAWDQPMRELMKAYDQLESDGICIALKDKRFETASDWHPLHDAVDADLRDEHFLYQTYRAANKMPHVPSPGRGTMKGGGLAIRPPRYPGQKVFAEMTSERLNTALLFAEAEHVVPVANHPAFVAMLNGKLRRVLQEHRPEAVDRFSRRSRARFSMLSWEVLSEGAPPHSVERRSFHQILKYREESREQSMRFRSFLRQLESELTEDPWSDRSREEIAASIQRRVLPELQRVREVKADIWNRLFDEALTTVFSPRNVAGASAVTLALYYMPGVSYIDLIGGGGATLFAELLPKLLAARRDELARRRNSLFFIMGLQ